MIEWSTPKKKMEYFQNLKFTKFFNFDPFFLSLHEPRWTKLRIQTLKTQKSLLFWYEMKKISFFSLNFFGAYLFEIKVRYIVYSSKIVNVFCILSMTFRKVYFLRTCTILTRNDFLIDWNVTRIAVRNTTYKKVKVNICSTEK